MRKAEFYKNLIIDGKDEPRAELALMSKGVGKNISHKKTFDGVERDRRAFVTRR